MEINSVYRENSILNGMIKHNGLALHKGRKKLQGVDINEKIFSVFILAGIMMFSTTCFASMFDDLKIIQITSIMVVRVQEYRFFG